MNSSTLPFRVAQIATAMGSDPDVIERDMEDCTEVYGDSLDLFPMIDRFCESPDAPASQCEFNAVALEWDRCIYCGKRG